MRCVNFIHANAMVKKCRLNNKQYLNLFRKKCLTFQKIQPKIRNSFLLTDVWNSTIVTFSLIFHQIQTIVSVSISVTLVISNTMLFMRTHYWYWRHNSPIRAASLVDACLTGDGLFCNKYMYIQKILYQTVSLMTKWWNIAKQPKQRYCQML